MPARYQESSKTQWKTNGFTPRRINLMFKLLYMSPIAGSL
jgi:hypothetical protein